MDKQRLNELFQKFADSGLNEEEKKEFFERLQDPKSRTELETLFAQMWEETDASLDLEAERRIQAAMSRIETERKRPNWSWLGWAAASLVLFTVGLFWLQRKSTEPSVPAVAQLKIETEYGQKKTIRLPDSTTVFLNAGSMLCYSSDFNQSNRQVKLIGEAYFEVFKKTDLPFVVESEGLNAEVLGTAFNVKAFPEEGNVFVALKQGGLKIHHPVKDSNAPEKVLVLKPGQQISYHKNSGESIIRSIAKNETWGDWRKELLSFNALPFSEVKPLLERWYNVKIEVSNPHLLNCVFTGSFTNKPIDRVLSLLSMSGNFRYTIVEDTVYIKGAGCR